MKKVIKISVTIIAVMAALGVLYIGTMLLITSPAFAPQNAVFDAYPLPESGRWYCEVLTMEVSFDNGKNHDGYWVIDGRKIICRQYITPGTAQMYVRCQDHNETEFYMGENIFVGTILEYEGDMFKVEERETKTIYIFRRTE